MPIYLVGDRVSQAQYGDGTVTVSNEHHTVIDFDQHGPRTFSTVRVHLERTTSIAPPKPEKKRRAPRAAAKAASA